MGVYKSMLEDEKSRKIRRKTSKFDLPFEIYIQDESITDKFLRNRDKTAVDKYNAKIQAWGNYVRADLTRSIKELIDVDKKLSNSLKNRYYTDGKSFSGDNRDFEIDRIGFSFVPEGVFVHLGVGRGYYRSGQSTFRNPNNRSTGMRRPKEWFNPVVKVHIESLVKIVQEYAADMIVNSSRIYIQS